MNKQGPNGIPWCDYTWSPIVGCSPASDGCINCYAAAISKRFHLPWRSARFMPERLCQPAKVRKPGRIFVCSMADLGHHTVEVDWRAAVCKAMLSAPWHTFIILTKRPGAWLRELPPSCWVGTTIEAQKYANRWPTLNGWAWPGAVKFVSVEPMLAPVSFADFGGCPDWIVAGPETGPKARPCDDAWLDALAAESPVFFDKRKVWTRREYPQLER